MGRAAGKPDVRLSKVMLKASLGGRKDTGIPSQHHDPWKEEFLHKEQGTLWLSHSSPACSISAAVGLARPICICLGE